MGKNAAKKILVNKWIVKIILEATLGSKGLGVHFENDPMIICGEMGNNDGVWQCEHLYKSNQKLEKISLYAVA